MTLQQSFQPLLILNLLTTLSVHAEDPPELSEPIASIQSTVNFHSIDDFTYEIKDNIPIKDNDIEPAKSHIKLNLIRKENELFLFLSGDFSAQQDWLKKDFQLNKGGFSFEVLPISQKTLDETESKLTTEKEEALDLKREGSELFEQKIELLKKKVENRNIFDEKKKRLDALLEKQPFPEDTKGDDLRTKATQLSNELQLLDVGYQNIKEEIMTTTQAMHVVKKDTKKAQNLLHTKRMEYLAEKDAFTQLEPISELPLKSRSKPESELASIQPLFNYQYRIETPPTAKGLIFKTRIKGKVMIANLADEHDGTPRDQEVPLYLQALHTGEIPIPETSSELSVEAYLSSQNPTESTDRPTGQQEIDVTSFCSQRISTDDLVPGMISPTFTRFMDEFSEKIPLAWKNAAPFNPELSNCFQVTLHDSGGTPKKDTPVYGNLRSVGYDSVAGLRQRRLLGQTNSEGKLIGPDGKDHFCLTHEEAKAADLYIQHELMKTVLNRKLAKQTPPSPSELKQKGDFLVLLELNTDTPDGPTRQILLNRTSKDKLLFPEKISQTSAQVLRQSIQAIDEKISALKKELEKNQPEILAPPRKTVIKKTGTNKIQIKTKNVTIPEHSLKSVGH